LSSLTDNPARCGALEAHADSSPEADAEHIFIEDALAPETVNPKAVTSRSLIRNRLGGVQTELSFYAEGFVRVREGTRKRLAKDHVIELQFIDPHFRREQSFAKNWLWLAVAMAVAAGGARLLLPMAGLAGQADWIAIALLAGALVAGRLFLLRTREMLVFSTVSGRTEVLRLTANLGCLRQFRQAAARISAAIAGTGARPGSDEARFLRAEMQAHYRMLESGIISREACSNGTAQILARFG